MSKTIEFIEKEIEKLKDLLELDDVLCLTTDDDYKFLYNRLKMFQQIKAELEAWEESKKYFILNEGCVPFYESTYEYITLKNDCIDESNSEEEGISIIKIKKALEVE